MLWAARYGLPQRFAPQQQQQQQQQQHTKGWLTKELRSRGGTVPGGKAVLLVVSSLAVALLATSAAGHARALAAAVAAVR
jgi:hypothetical protein